MGNEQNEQWVSVSSLSRMKKCSTQTIYNKIKKGEYETRTFERGTKMIGILVKVPEI